MKNFANKFQHLSLGEFKELLKSEDLLKLLRSDLKFIEKESIDRLYNVACIISIIIITILSLRNEFKNMVVDNNNNLSEYDQEFKSLNSIKYDEHIDLFDISDFKVEDIVELSRIAMVLLDKYNKILEVISTHRRENYYNSIEDSYKDYLSGKFNLGKDTLRKIRKEYPTVISLFNILGVDNKIINPFSDYILISKFSDLSFIKNKNKQREFMNELTVYNSSSSLNMLKSKDLNISNGELTNTVIEDMLRNKNEYLTGVCSFVFISKIKFFNELQNMVNNLLIESNFSKDNNEVFIKHVFLVMKDANIISNPMPTFYQIINPDNQNCVININILSLSDFSNIYATLNYEYYIFKKSSTNNLISIQNKNQLMKYNFIKNIMVNGEITKSILCFNGISWPEIRTSLLKAGININFGDTTKRAIISPNEYDLSLFINKFLNISHSEVSRSFNNVGKDYYSSKGIKYPEVNMYDSNYTLNMISSYYEKFKITFKDIMLEKQGFDLFEDELFDDKLRYVFLQEVINKKVLSDKDVIARLIFDYNRESIDKETTNKIFKSINKIKSSKVRKFNNISIRKFSTTTINRNLNTNTDYYDNLKYILSQNKYDPVKTQTIIEQEWLKILMSDLNKEKSILRGKLLPIVERAVESTITADFNKILYRLCGNLNKYLINKECVLISLIEIVENYQTSKRTNIAKNIGYALMRQIYIKLTTTIEKNHSIDIREQLGLKAFIEIISSSDAEQKGTLVDEVLNLNSKLVVEYKLSRDNLESIIEYQNKANGFLVTLGTRFIELFSTRPNMVFIEVSESSGIDGGYTKLVLSEEYKNLVNDFIKLSIRPKNLPMVCKPLKWGAQQYGGYLENNKIKDDVITGSIDYNAHEYINKDKLYKTINYFNSILFGINHKLLDYIQNEGKYLLEIPKVSGDESLKMNTEISIKIANLFRNTPFYLNTHADWRGRIYTHSFYITYQGSELSSALLQFVKGEPLTDTGLNMFLAYGASLYSSLNNSKPEEERIEWINKNKNLILELNKDFILESKSPISFTAFCLEMQELENNKNTIIKMPIYIDATCSGIQHISALIGDIELATKSNVILNPNNKGPEDFYLSLVDPINKAINEYGKNHPEYDSLSKLQLTRDILKTPIMTLNYNVSIFGMKEQLYNNLKKTSLKLEDPLEIESNKTIKNSTIIAISKDNKKIILTNRDLIKIAMIIRETIFVEYPSLKMIYDYFIEVATLMKKLNLSIQWVTPTGAVITQKYSKREKTKLTIRSNNRVKTIVLYKRTKRIDHLKQIDGIIPNVIHSLDSSHIINFINESAKNVNFDILTVHDCFGTHPNHIEELFSLLKQEFINLYINHDFLKKFDKNIISTIRNHYAEDVRIENRKLILTVTDSKTNKTKIIEYLIPKPPTKRDLDYSFIRLSKWMFN